MAMITDADDFFSKGCGRCDRFATLACSTRLWIDGLNGLHRIFRDMGLEKAAKWAHPTYIHAGRNIAILGAFRGDFRLSFLNSGLLKDTEDLLEPQGTISQTPGIIRFTAVGQVGDMEPVIRACLRQLMNPAEAGTKPPRVEREINMPEELTEALDADSELAEAFHTMTPGRQKSYMFNLNQAWQSATRVARIEMFRENTKSGYSFKYFQALASLRSAGSISPHTGSGWLGRQPLHAWPVSLRDCGTKRRNEGRKTLPT